VDGCLLGLFRVDFLFAGGVMARCRGRRFWTVGPVLLANVTVFLATLTAGTGPEVFLIDLAPSELGQGGLEVRLVRRLG